MGAESLIAELRDLVTCRCSPDYTKRGLRDPACNCDTAPALDALAARLAECEANLAQAIADLLAERAAKTIIGQSYESERTAREAAEALVAGLREQHARDSAELRILCGAKDAYRAEAVANMAAAAAQAQRAERAESAIERVRGCLEEIVTGGWLDDGSRESNAMRAKAADILRAVGEGE